MAKNEHAACRHAAFFIALFLQMPRCRQVAGHLVCQRFVVGSVAAMSRLVTKSLMRVPSGSEDAMRL